MHEFRRIYSFSKLWSRKLKAPNLLENIDPRDICAKIFENKYKKKEFFIISLLRMVKWWYEPVQTSKSNSSFLTKWFVTVKLLGVIFKWFLSDVLQYITLYSSLIWHNFKWRHKLRLQASAVIMMLTNNAIKVCLWRENFAGILLYASALVHVMCEQIILVWVDEIFFRENFY